MLDPELHHRREMPVGQLLRTLLIPNIRQEDKYANWVFTG